MTYVLMMLLISNATFEVTFLGAFGKLRKVTVNFVISLSFSVSVLPHVPKFAIKALLRITLYCYIAGSDMQLKKTHRMHCCAFRAKCLC